MVTEQTVESFKASQQDRAGNRKRFRMAANKAW